MKLSEMKVDPKRFDQTELDEAEQQFVLNTVAAIGNQLVALAMSEGVIIAVQAAGGAVARMIKANLETGIQVADPSQLRLFTGGRDGKG